MIWELLEILDSPQDYAIRMVNGEIHVAPIFDIPGRVIDLDSSSAKKPLPHER